MKTLLSITTFLFLLLSFTTTAHAFDIRKTFYNSSVYTPSSGAYVGPDSLADIYNPILNLVYILSGIIILTSFLWGGFVIISNSGNAQEVAKGQKIITTTLIGLVALVSVYWIVQLVEYLTGLRGAITNPQQLLP